MATKKSEPDGAVAAAAPSTVVAKAPTRPLDSMLDQDDAADRQTLRTQLKRLREHADELQANLDALERSTSERHVGSAHNLATLVCEIQRTLTLIETRRLVRGLHRLDGEQR